MLILTRCIGETLKVGNSITVTVLGVKGNQVRNRRQTAEERRGASRRDLRADQVRKLGARCRRNRRQDE